MNVAYIEKSNRKNKCTFEKKKEICILVEKEDTQLNY